MAENLPPDIGQTPTGLQLNSRRTSDELRPEFVNLYFSQFYRKIKSIPHSLTF